MRISKSESAGKLVIEGLGENELQMLRGVREAADPAACPEAEKRLFPRLIADAGEEDMDAIADWEEFVVPDLRSQFNAALGLLEDDVAAAEVIRKRPLKRYRITIAREHVEPWFSALNQARLVLQEKYRLPGENERLSLDELFAKGQWRAYFQSRFYAEIQCWLIELGMR